MLRRLMIAGAAALTYDAAVLADSPVGYWKLDETVGAVAADSSGSGRHGAYVGAPGLSVGGVTLNGSSQCVTFTNSAFNSVGAANQPFTLEISVTAISGIVSPSAIFDKTKVSGTADWITLQNVSGAPHFQLYDGTSNPIVTGSTLPVGTEVMLHAVRDPAFNVIRMYRNGVHVDTVAGSSAIDVANTIALCVGARQAGTDRFARIKARRAAVYLSALSPARIAAHYAASL